MTPIVCGLLTTEKTGIVEELWLRSMLIVLCYGCNIQGYIVMLGFIGLLISKHMDAVLRAVLLSWF